MIFSSNQSAHPAANSAGGKCLQVGTFFTSNGSELKCVKQNSKLIWKRIGSITRISQANYSISVTGDSSAKVYPSGSGTYKFGSVRTFTFEAQRGYRITNVIVDNIAKGPIHEFTFSWISSNHSISVTTTPLAMPIPTVTQLPVPVGFSITAGSDSGGVINPTGVSAVNSGGSLSFAIGALNGYQISNVLVDGASQGAITSYSFNNVEANHTISVVTQSGTANFSINAGSDLGGSINPSGASIVDSGGSLSYAISPLNGYQISSVDIDGVNQGVMTSVSFNNVQANHTIYVFTTLDVVNYSITASSDGGATINPSGASTVSSGGTMSYSFAATSGYHITDVVIDGASSGNVTPFVFTNVQANHTISIVTTSDPITPKDVLPTDGVLNSGQSLTSSDGRFLATMQSDGNFVVYGPTGALWATNTSAPGSYIVIQGDGNLVVYNSAGKALWSSATAPSDGDYLVMQSDGNLVLYPGGGSALWASNTVYSGGGSSGSGVSSDSTFGYPNANAIDCSATYGIYSWCENGSWLSPLRFAYRNCTDFVAWKLGITWGSMNFPGGDGNARGWINSPRFTHSSTPTLGSVAWWGTDVGGGYGHVAYVVGVNSDGSANVEQYNWSGKGEPSTRTVKAEAYLVLHN